MTESRFISDFWVFINEFEFHVKKKTLFLHLPITTTIPLLGEVAHNSYASCAVTATYTTLVILEFGANDAIAACPYTLPLHTHWAAVRTALSPVCHLQASEVITVNYCFFMSKNRLKHCVSTHSLREYHIVSCSFCSAGQFADIFRKNSCILGHPLNKSLYTFRVRLGTITDFALLLPETLSWKFHLKLVEIMDLIYNEKHFCIWSQAFILTWRWTWCDTAGPIDGSLACAVAAIVSRWRIVTETLGKLHSTSTSPWTWTPWSPRAPAAVVGCLDKNEEMSEDRECWKSVRTRVLHINRLGINTIWPALHMLPHFEKSPKSNP